MDGMTLERMQVIIDAQTQSYRDALKQVTTQTQAMTNDVTKQTAKIKSAFGGIGKFIVGIGIGAALIKTGKDAIKFTSDLQEVQNVVDTAFESMSYKAEQFSKNSIDNFGMSELTAKRTASTYMAMSKGIGLIGSEASDMAIKVAGLTGDVSSFYNVNQSQADTALKSIWTGETESLKQFGVVMTQANLQQFAHTKGIEANISAMKQADQVRLRYMYVTNQLKLADGDFAKTSDSWANQTRILAERFKQLLGILGNGLMQVLSPVLKMINQLMAGLVSFAQTFSNVIGALFGKKTGKQSPMTQAQEQANAAIGSATDLQGGYNDELDKTTGKAKKAAKEVANLFSFDQITKINSDTDSGDGAGAGGGGGIGPIDPIDFGWDQEQDISGIEKTVAKVKSLLEDVFETFVNSWVKYGDPIIETFKRGFDNIIYIGKDVFRVIGDHWKTTIQPITDLILSMAETVGLVFEGITIILKNAWDNGGAYLLGKIMDFVGAVANLATAINDNFIKPIIRWFNDNLAPVIGNVIGLILEKIGDLLSALTKLINYIADNKAVLTVFTTAVTTMIGAWTTVKLVTWVNSFGGVMGALTLGKRTIKDFIINGMTKLYVAYDDANKALITFAKGIKDSWTTLKNTVSKIYNLAKAWIAETIAKKDSGKVDLVKTFKNIGTAIGETIKKIAEWIKQLVFGKVAQEAANTANKAQAASTTALAIAEGTATTATGALSTAMAFLAANPIVAVIGAIGLVVGGLALWASSQNDTSKDIEKTTEKANAQAEAIKELQKSMADNLANSTVDIDNVRVYVEELKGLIDAEGKVIGNKDRVLFLMSEINKVMPDSVIWTEKGTVAYKDGADALAKNILLKEAQLKLEAIEPAYKEAIMKKQSALNDMVRANGEYMTKNAELKKLESKGIQNFTQEDMLNYKILSDGVAKLDGVRQTTTQNYQNLSNITSQYSNLATATQTGDMQKIAMASNALTVQFDADGNARTTSLESDTRDMQTTYNMMLKDMQLGNKNYTEEQLREQEIALNAKKNALYAGYVADCQNKDEMLALLMAHDGEISYEQALQFASQLKKQESAGKNEARAYLDNLKRDLDNGSIKKEGWGLFSQVKSIFDANPIDIKATISVWGGLKNFANGVKTAVENAMGGRSRMVSAGIPSGTQPISPANLPMLAKGGLTNGPMAAIIGEAGKEAVIPLENNTRAIDLITSKFLAGVPSQQSGDLHITLTLENGETITKQVIKDYNKLMYASGGQGGFNL